MISTTRHTLLAFATAALALTAASGVADESRFGARLSGASELPEPRDTKATGELEIVVSPDGQSLAYKLAVTNLTNPASADLHLGPATANGPLVVKLFPAHGATARKGPVNGVLVEGRIVAEDLAGPMTGSAIDALVEQIRDGNAYVNIHTSDGMDPPDSGPGDYRLGEIRGQIE